MKKLISAFMAATLALCLTACAGAPASEGEPKDYQKVITDTRVAGEDSAFEIVADKSADMADSAFSMLSIDAADVDKFAISCSFLNVNAYCVAIIKPTSGKETAIKDALQSYVDLQKKNMENYLPEQFAIADAAVVKTLKSGEVILVMCKDSETVAKDIEKALK
ncbi:MAG: DUF4358 domain-containing protein [Oscillospiraceae bacterium]